MSTETFELIYIRRASEVFHDNLILFTQDAPRVNI